MHLDHPKPRCFDCQRLTRRCLCEYQPSTRAQSPIKLTLIQTQAELDHPKNSGALLRLGLQDIETAVITLPSHHQSDPRACEVLKASISRIIQSHNCGSTALLYPESAHQQSAVALTECRAVSAVPTHLIALDMTWGHSERLIHIEPSLSELPRFSLDLDKIMSIRGQFKSESDEKQANFSHLRSGKRQQNQISSFEATLFSLVALEAHLGNYALSKGTKRYRGIWAQYQRWIKDQLDLRPRDHRSTR